MGAPRIAPGTRADVGLVNWGVAQALGRVNGTEAPHLFLTLGRHRALFRGWLRFAARLMPGGKLPRRETELVILRVAHLRRCAYEFDHHVHLARRAGVTATDVNRVQVGPHTIGWTRREQVMLAAVDQLHHGGDIHDATWDELWTVLSEREIIELVLLATHYELLATVIGTLRIQPDGRRH